MINYGSERYRHRKVSTGTVRTFPIITEKDGDTRIINQFQLSLKVCFDVLDGELSQVKKRILSLTLFMILSITLSFRSFARQVVNTMKR